MNSFTKARINAKIPNRQTIAGPLEILRLYDKYIPTIEPTIPIIQLKKNRFFHLLAKRVAMALGAIRSIKTRKIPPIGTAFTITIPNVI
jgi:hypothetical protein